MPFKKILPTLLASVFLLGSVSVYAEHDIDMRSVDLTPDANSLPPYPWKEMGLYLQGDVGYVRANWNNNLYPITVLSSRHNHGGFTGGGAMGYQVNPMFAAEAGAFYIPSVSFTNIVIGPDTIRNFFAYAAGKLIVPLPVVVPGFSVFLKAGVAFRFSQINNSLWGDHDSNSWRPLIGIGTQYYLTRDLYTSIQWMLVPKGNGFSIYGQPIFAKLPMYNLFTVGLGYRFTF